VAKRVYSVEINTPVGDDDFEFAVEVKRHGKTIAEFSDALVPAMAKIGEAIGLDIEGEL
jgi:hypothetical protein